MYISVSFAFYAPCGMLPLQRMSTHAACLSVSLGISSLSTCTTAAIMHIPHVSYTHISVAICHTCAFALRSSSQMAEQARCCRSRFQVGMSTAADIFSCHQQHFMICHSKNCHRPCTSLTCHIMQRDASIWNRIRVKSQAGMTT